ncbi:MAG: hypothetical protein LBS53_03440 [Synergistaceae bacterium]|jgi:hypothetical protein|nr:hypothetical protein [Synergistaceae bacterium]
MNIAPIASADFWWEFLRAEMMLTANVAAGLVVGELILGLGVVDRLFAPVIPSLARWGIHGKIAAAMLMAVGSPRSGAGVISGAYLDGEISRKEATCGTLALAFPGYLRRWVGTAAIAAGIAGVAGVIFAAAILVRSACRFVWVVLMLIKRGAGRVQTGGSIKKTELSAKERAMRTLKLLRRSLPWAWGFFALTYALVPFVDRAFSEYVAKMGFYAFLPLEGWTVAVSSIAHITAGLSSSAGAMSAGKLGVGQAVLALLVGNMAGSITRTMRQNVGYWVGIFPKDMIPGLLKWHMITTLTLEVVSILIAWCASGVS